MANYFELHTTGHANGQMAKYLGIDVELLGEIMDDLGLFENMRGRLQGRNFVAMSGETFPIDLDKMKLDKVITIKSIELVDGVRVAQITGFPLTLDQLERLKAKIASL